MLHKEGNLAKEPVKMSPHSIRRSELASMLQARNDASKCLFRSFSVCYPIPLILSEIHPQTWGTLLFHRTLQQSIVLSFRFPNMISDLCFMPLAIRIAVTHEILDTLTLVHGIQRVQNQLAIYLHIEEIGVNAASLFSGEIMFYIYLKEIFVF